MLKDKLFIIKEKQDAENGCTYRLSLKASHPIYEAHFAGSPVTPGACIIQIIKELAQDFLNRPLAVDTVKNTKFLNVINPLVNNEISVEIKFKSPESNVFTLSATLSDGEILFSKCSLEVIEIQLPCSRIENKHLLL